MMPLPAPRSLPITLYSDSMPTLPSAASAATLGSQSSLGVMFTDREVGPYFNRVGGIDGRFKLNSNWVASFQGVVSSTLCSDTRNNACTFGTYLAGPAAEVTLQRDGTETELLHGLCRPQ